MAGERGRYAEVEGGAEEWVAGGSGAWRYLLTAGNGELQTAKSTNVLRS